jgi:ribosomal protein S18 acetylase RimI-like enzyme
MIRKIELSDVPRVAEIQIFCWRFSDKGILSDEYLFKNMLVDKRMKYFENEIITGTDDFYVYDDGIIKAFLIIAPCKDDDMTDSFQMWSIYVDPFFFIFVICSRLLEHFEIIAIQNQYSKVCLWVMEHNQNAKSFYEKHNYLPDGKKAIYEIGTTEIRYTKNI